MKPLEQDKMKERVDWSFAILKQKAKDEGLTVSDDVMFTQACEMGRCLFVRSEIAYSGSR